MIDHYFSTKLGKLFLGDTLELLPLLPEVDFILTDPPYGVGMEYNHFDDTPENVKALIKDFIPLAMERSKLMFLTPGTQNLALYPDYNYCLAILQPCNPGYQQFGNVTWQPIIVYGKDPHSYTVNQTIRWTTVPNTKVEPKCDFHPCAKPITTWTKILLRGSLNTTDIILDPFIGRGTTAIACEMTGRRWYGIDNDEKYLEGAAKEIEWEAKRLKLFY